ncbi:urease accessory protein UreD [Oceanicoccus sp. KOV_DT_Chl]|uniref:urease accessory protein UreD n=1 Tax=Oceanicoccus sp. KOV_DT_Chl TaxID=1904639 RepID=UPI000C7C0100|nr:urease accessory protein UreD [Oceanicoccus sp. KOV_DT_Chl]
MTVSSSALAVNASAPSFCAEQADGWQASLQLQLKHKGVRTVLQSSVHHGPLRVQRPFYPEGGVCHLYLLHPPGGMVAGDNLTIGLDCQSASQTLVTTPAAGKLYRVAAQASPQYQGVSAKLAAGAELEWLPQETILFNGARGELRNRFDLAADSRLLGWDIVCLGRRASGECFDSGQVKQRIEIYREGRPLLIDRVNFRGGSDMLNAPWGMAQQPVSGTLFATINTGVAISAEALRAVLPAVDTNQQWGLSERNGILLVRYLGNSAEVCRRGFERIWQQLRPTLMIRPMLRPRIWNT